MNKTESVSSATPTVTNAIALNASLVKTGTTPADRAVCPAALIAASAPLSQFAPPVTPVTTSQRQDPVLLSHPAAKQEQPLMPQEPFIAAPLAAQNAQSLQQEALPALPPTMALVWWGVPSSSVIVPVRNVQEPPQPNAPSATKGRL